MLNCILMPRINKVNKRKTRKYPLTLVKSTKKDIFNIVTIKKAELVVFSTNTNSTLFRDLLAFIQLKNRLAISELL